MSGPCCPLSKPDSPPVGLVLSGGGARGAFQIGVWDVLRHDVRGLRKLPLVISGTSAGAINGMLIAAGRSPREMLDFWLDLAKRPPVTANVTFFRSLRKTLRRMARREPLRPWRQRGREVRLLASLVRKHKPFGGPSRLAMGLEYLFTARFDSISDTLDGIETAHLFSTRPFRKRLADVIGGTELRNPRVRLAINTVDARSGKVVRFTSHEPKKREGADASHYQVGPITVDMVRASAAIPLLFDTVRVDGVPLWDGGLLVNTPLAPTVALGARRIIPVLVTAGGGQKAPVTLGGAVERLADAFLENAYSTDRKLLLERNRVAEAKSDPELAVVELYEALRPESSDVFNAGSYLYFEPDALIRMYEAGRDAARHWLDQGPRLDVFTPPSELPTQVLETGVG